VVFHPPACDARRWLAVFFNGKIPKMIKACTAGKLCACLENPGDKQ
jgi:hypothetical protein